MQFVKQHKIPVIVAACVIVLGLILFFALSGSSPAASAR